ncbi:hypothetical protein NRF20_45110 [Streptomyces sp. R-74717]|uniref:hypothetical protein n=1 Tax=Streptomyces TaxID=1883 RepID=UPI0037BC8312
MTAAQIAGRDAELSALTGSLGSVFNPPEPWVMFVQFAEGLLADAWLHSGPRPGRLPDAAVFEVVTR